LFKINSAKSKTFTLSFLSFAFTPSGIIVRQKGQLTALAGKVQIHPELSGQNQIQFLQGFKNQCFKNGLG
jgi:hypothetical protein